MAQILLYVFYLTFNNTMGASFSDEIIINSSPERGAQLGFSRFGMLFFHHNKNVCSHSFWFLHYQHYWVLWKHIMTKDHMFRHVKRSLYARSVTHGGLVLGLLKSFWKRRANSSRMVTPLPLESAPYEDHCVTYKYKHMHKHKLFNGAELWKH